MKSSEYEVFDKRFRQTPLSIRRSKNKMLLGDFNSIRNNPGINDISKFNRNLHRFSAGLDLYQYQSFSAGFNYNVFFFNNNDLKYRFDINFGVQLGIMQVTDSVASTTGTTGTKRNTVNNYSVNTMQLYPEMPDLVYIFPTLNQKGPYLRK